MYFKTALAFETIAWIDLLLIHRLQCIRNIQRIEIVAFMVLYIRFIYMSSEFPFVSDS